MNSGVVKRFPVGVLDHFPRLKLAFLEAGSEWLPYTIHQLDRRYSNRGGSSFGTRRKPSEYLQDGNIASDYPHGDPSREEDMVGALNSRTDVPARVREKILSHNARGLYQL